MFYATIEVTGIDEDLATDAIQCAVDSLSLTVQTVDLPSLVIEPSARARGARGTFTIESSTKAATSSFIQAVNAALRALITVRLHWVKPSATVFVDIVPAPTQNER